MVRSNVLRTLQQRCGVEIVGECMEVRCDEAGGLGMFALRELEKSEVVARIPWSSVMGPEGVSDPYLEVAAKILSARVGRGSDAWCAIADCVDWNSLRRHPIAMAKRQETVLHPLLKDPDFKATPAFQQQFKATLESKLEDVASDVEDLKTLSGCADDDKCLEAILATQSRAFNLSHLRPGAVPCFVPLADTFNHPSRSSLSDEKQFVQVLTRHANVFLTQDDDSSLCMRAPRDLAVNAGDQLFFWYGDGGLRAQTPSDFHQGEIEFYLQYGFSLWD